MTRPTTFRNRRPLLALAIEGALFCLAISGFGLLVGLAVLQGLL